MFLYDNYVLILGTAIHYADEKILKNSFWDFEFSQHVLPSISVTTHIYSNPSGEQ